ncbi:hypothetical protein [Mycolicibacterium fortuitum]|uniref:hypothetical protein n=1 Tax=Mycolicibacterium fortuitum TaxID=1766 RepID=UPI00148F7C98|nr:hypothetical protein [Mycolicibacterium fortuitum]
MIEPSPLSWLEQTVRVTRDGVYFGDAKLPGCIAEDGVTIRPGGGERINRLTVEFLVGEVITEDPTEMGGKS